MSREVVKMQAGQIGLTKRKRSLKSLLPKLDPPVGMAQKTPDANRFFKPIVSGEGWLAKQRDAVFMACLVPGISECLLLPLGIPAGIFAPQPVGGIILTALVAAQAAWIPAFVFGIRTKRAKRLNFNSFLQWLHGRYGITLDAKQQLYSLLSSRYPSLTNEQFFLDDQGRQLSIEWSYANDGFYVTATKEQLEPLQLVSRAASEAYKSGSGELSHPLRKLYLEIQERLTSLADRNLSPESDHVVARAKRDVAKVIALYSELTRLHALDEKQEAAVQATFISLINELTEIIKKETAFALAELTVETTYVAARQPRKGIELTKKIDR